MRAAAVVFAVAGCAPPILTPPPTPGAESAIVVAEGRERHAYASELARLRDKFELPDGTTHLVALMLPLPLTAYALETGELALAPEAATRPWPAALRVSRQELSDGGLALGPWVELSEALPRGLPAIEPTACAEHGGCWAPEGGCALPCPEPTAPAPPAAPELMSLAPCTHGWAEFPFERALMYRGDNLQFRMCDPNRCPEGEDAELGSCTPSARACEFPAALVEAETFFVRPGAAGDGSRAAPGDLRAALASGRPVIALEAGEHPWPSETSSVGPRRIVGACPRETRIRGGLALTLDASRFEALHLVDLPLHCARGACVARELITESSTVALIAAGGDFALEESAVRTAPGYGVRAEGTSSLSIRRTELINGPITLIDDASAELGDVQLIATASITRSAVRVFGSAQLRAEALRVTGTWGRGLFVTGAATASVTQLSLEGSGLRVQEGGAMTLRRSRIMTPAPGRPIECYDRATLDADRLYMAGNGGQDAWSPGATFACASARLRHVLVEHMSEDAIMIGGDGGHTVIEDLVALRGKRFVPTDTSGRAISVRGAPRGFELRRALIADHQGAGIGVYAATSGVLEDVTLMQLGKGGLEVGHDAQLRVQRVSVLASYAFGVRVGDDARDTSLEGSDLMIDVVQPDLDCRVEALCRGVGLGLRAKVVLERFSIGQSSLANAMVATWVDGTSLSDGVLGPGPIGLSVPKDQLHPESLLVGVATTDNTLPIDLVE